jgi:hypothetical protein
MKPSLVILAVALCQVALGGDTHAPLPDRIVSARTVFIQNDSVEQKFADNVFIQLQQWNR